MEISASQVMELRRKTGLPMMDCKSALVEASGDFDQAIEILKKKGLMRAAKMADRVASEGRVACHVDSKARTAGIVELRCETAPVANTDDFIQLARLLAQAAAALQDPTPEKLLAAPVPGQGATTFQDYMHEVFNRIREKMEIARVGRVTGPAGGYTHHDGRKGAIVAFSDDCPAELASGVCMHVVAINPQVLKREEVSPSDVSAVRASFEAEAKGKPPAVVEKIVSGKLDRWYSELVLLEQPFVVDDKKTVRQALQDAKAGLTIHRFLRFEVGRVG